MQHQYDKHWNLDKKQPNAYLRAAGMVIGLPLALAGAYFWVYIMYILIN